MNDLEELKQQENKAKDLLREIKNATEMLINDELTLQDIVALEEQLKDNCDELQETCKEIIHLRQWIDFENSRPF